MFLKLYYRFQNECIDTVRDLLTLGQDQIKELGLPKLLEGEILKIIKNKGYYHQEEEESDTSSSGGSVISTKAV